MQSRLLVDAIVQQTTVLIAQLSTAAGIRAPLAHIADQVFLELSREIERQGVGRKIAADMFGLALRSYQKRVQRLSESATVRDRTLWEAIYDFVCEQQSVSRERVEKRFAKDSEDDVAAIINDLVSNGLIYAAGRGRSAIYRAVTAQDRESADEGDGQSLQSLVWMLVYRRRARSLEELRGALNVDERALREAVDQLVADKRLTRGSGPAEPELHADTLLVPVGAERGWEAAVLDHFRAVAVAIGSKVQRGPRSAPNDLVGGATLSFDMHPGHPCEAEVYGLLGRMRADINELWNRVVAYSEVNPVPDEQKTKVTFYFGQNVEPVEPEQQESQP
jgi:hypothetical protein